MATGGGFTFGGGGGAPAPAPAPAPATAPVTFPSFQPPGTTPAAPGAPPPAPAPAPFGGLATPAPPGGAASFQFGGAGGTGGGVGAAAPTPTPTTAPPPPATGSTGAFAFGGDGATAAPTTAGGGGGGGGVAAPSFGAPGGGGGAALPPLPPPPATTLAAPAPPAPQSTKSPPIKFDDLYKDAEGYDNTEIRSFLDQLAQPKVSEEVIKLVGGVMKENYFQTWMASQLLYFTTSTQASKDNFRKASTLRLFPSSHRQVPLPGGEEEKQFIKCLSNVLQLEEQHTVHVVHQYQRSIYRSNRWVGQDTMWTKDEYRSRYRLREVVDYYLNERLMLLMNARELILIQSDPEYVHKQLAPLVSQCLNAAHDEKHKGAAFLVKQALRQVRWLMEWAPPSAQDMDPEGWFKGVSPDDWEAYRRDLAYQNLMEVDAVLDLLLILVSSMDMCFRDWEEMVRTWLDVRLGELSPVKQYLVRAGQIAIKAHKVRTIPAKMIMATIQAMQLNALCNRRLTLAIGDGSQGSDQEAIDHPFLADLKRGDAGVLFDILSIFQQQTPRPANAEYFGVILLCWSCFLHLTRSQAGDTLRRRWANPSRLYIEMVHQVAAFHTLADMVYDLLAQTPADSTKPSAAAGSTSSLTTTTTTGPQSTSSLLKELWARLGYQDILRSHARQCGRYQGPNHIQLIIKNTLLEMLEGILAAGYVGTVWARTPMIPPEYQTLPRTRFLAMLSAVAVHENPDYSPALVERLEAWCQKGRRKEDLDSESPILFLLDDTFKRDPLFFFHMVSSLACGPRLAQYIARSPFALGRQVRSRLPQKSHYEFKTDEKKRLQFFELTGSTYFNELGVVLPKGVRGTNIATAGQYPIVRWNFSLGALVLSQFESFVNHVHELRLRPILKELERTRRRLSSTLEEASNLGLSSLFDRFPALFAYGPSPGDRDSYNFVDILIKHGAWPILRYSLRRVEMVIDQLALLITRDETLLRYIDRVEVVRHGAPGFFLTYRLPRALVRLVHAVMDALDSSTPVDEMEALTSLQVGALNLLRTLMKRLPFALGGEYVGRIIFDQVAEARRESKDTLTPGDVPFLVSVATQAVEYGGVQGQYSVVSQSVSLMRRVMLWAYQQLDVLSFPGRSELMVKMVEFVLKTLISMETWSFATTADRWTLARRCLHVLDDFLRPPFVDDVASIKTLEECRYAVYDRFRSDNALMRALLRSVGSQTLPALFQVLNKRAKQEELVRDQGIFELRPVLPLNFDDMADEERRATDKALGILILILQHFTPRLHTLPVPPEPGRAMTQVSGSAIGALALMMRSIDVPTTRFSRISRASPISFTVVLASLIKHPDPTIRLQAVEAFTLLISFTKRLSKAREVEALYSPGPILESTKGPLLDLLPLQEAHRLRAMLFSLLLEEWSRNTVLCGAVLNLLVEAIRQQPSLASVLVYVDMEVAKDTSPQAKTLSVLVSSLVCQAGDGLMEHPWLYRFLWTVLKGAMARTKWLQTFLESIPQRDKFWAMLLSPVLSDNAELEEEPTLQLNQLMQEDGPASTASVASAEKAYRKAVESYCRRAASCRYLMDSLALLWHTTASVNNASVKKTVEDLIALIQSKGQQLRHIRSTFTMMCKYRTAKLYEMEEDAVAMLSSVNGRGALPASSQGSDEMKLTLAMDDAMDSDKPAFDLSRFRKADGVALMRDGDPLKFREYWNFLYDVAAVRRFLTSKGASAEERAKAEKLMGDINEYYAKTGVQMGLLSAWKNLVQVDAYSGGRALLQENGLEELLLILAEDQVEYEKSLQPLKDIIKRLDQLPPASLKRESVKLAAMVNISRTIRLHKLDLVVCLLSRRAREPLPSTEPSWKKLVKGVEVNFERLWAERANYVDQNLNLKIRLRLATAFLLLVKGVDTQRLQSGDSAEWWRVKPQIRTIWSSACATLAMLDKLLVDNGRPAMTCFLLRDLESVIQMCLSILDAILRLLRVEARPSTSRGGVEESKGPEQSEADGDDDLDKDEYCGRWQSLDKAFELDLIEDMKSHNLMSCLMQYFAAASAVAAQEFPSLHNYAQGMTRPLAPRRGIPTAASERPSPELAHASLRMSSILKFFVSASIMSVPFASELFDAHILSFLSQDPTVAQIADVLDREPMSERDMDETRHFLTKELMYMRGYQVDRKRSISYQLWNDVVRLVTVLVHVLTRPHLGYDVVLALEMPNPSKASLTYEKPLSGREGVVVDQAVAFLRRFQRLLSCPVRSERLTMALLDEAQVVMTFFREMAVHGYSWKTADGALHASIRKVIKLLVLRTSMALAGVCQEGPGNLLQKKLKDLFVTVSDSEKDQYKMWEESLKPTTPATSDLEVKIEAAMVGVLASAVAFTRYTGPLRLPPWIPLTPEEAAQIDISVGTRVKFRLPGESEAYRGKIRRRRWEYVYGQEHLMGTYEIDTYDAVTKGACVKTGISPTSIIAMQDGDALERHRKRALGDIIFELPDQASNQPSFNHGCLSSAHLLSLSVYCTKRLRDLPREAPSKRRFDLVTVLQHCLFLLVQCLPVFRETKGDKDLHDYLERLVGILFDVREIPGLRGGPTTLRGMSLRAKDRREIFVLEPSESIMMLGTKEEVDRRAAEACMAEDTMPPVEELNRLLDECGELGAVESVWRVMECVRRRRHQSAYSISFTTYVAALEALLKNSQWEHVVRLLEDEDFSSCLGDLKGLLR